MQESAFARRKAAATVAAAVSQDRGASPLLPASANEFEVLRTISGSGSQEARPPLAVDDALTIRNGTTNITSPLKGVVVVHLYAGEVSLTFPLPFR